MKILMFVLFMISLSSFADECSSLISDCEYYSCKEDTYQCGQKGYLIGFGKKYCVKFEENEYKYSSRGQLWLQNTRTCLTKQLSALGNSLTCSKLKNSAFKDHQACYLDNGFCQLPFSDKKLIMKQILNSAWRPQIIQAGLKVYFSCLNGRVF